MEELQEAREELAAVERELNMKSNQARERGGAELIRGDEVLKTHSYYPQHIEIQLEVLQGSLTNSSRSF